MTKEEKIEDYEKNWTYKDIQKLQLESGEIEVSSVEVEVRDYATVSLRIKVSGGDIHTINQMLDFQDIIKGKVLHCNFDGIYSIATLELIHKHEFSLETNVEFFHVLCSNIQATSHGDAKKYEFFLPYVKLGVADRSTSLAHPCQGGSSMRDHCVFTINGREWMIRHTYEIEGKYYNALETMRIARKSGLKKPIPSSSNNSMLEVSTADLPQEEAEKTANDICRLLQLAFGQTVGWTQLHLRNDDETTFLCSRANSIPSKNSPVSPIRNWCDGKIQRYLENAYPVYSKSPEWWSITLSWVALTFEIKAIESSLAINYILLDRISSFQLEKHSFGNLLGDSFSKRLQCKCDRSLLASKIENVLTEFSDDYPTSKTPAIIQKLQEWNKQPPYAQKINTTFRMNDLPDPPIEMLKVRHTLLHTGNVSSEPEEALQTYFLCNQQILLLLFSMLGYTGKFFATGMGEQDC